MKDEHVRKNNSIIVVSTVLWIISLFNGTGIGNAYGIYDKVIISLVLCMVYQILFRAKLRTMNKFIALCTAVILLQNLYTSIVRGSNFFEYLGIYIIPLLYASMTIDKKQIQIIGLIYGIGGGATLLIAHYTSVFAGWDGNSISQGCFFSYAVFISSMFDIRKKEHQQRIIIYSIIYFLFLLPLNSRSCIFFSAFLLLCELGILPVRSTINKNTILICLIIPLIFALIVISIADAPYISMWNQWSIEHFNKSFFSGRDELWRKGLEVWGRHKVIGIGSLAIRWHNSAVACLVGGGSIGYFVWIFVIREILVQACDYIHDNIIFGTVIAFLVIWLQQSLEIGIIGAHGNIIISVLLGLILARQNTLSKQNEKTVEIDE